MYAVESDVEKWDAALMRAHNHNITPLIVKELAFPDGREAMALRVESSRADVAPHKVWVALSGEGVNVTCDCEGAQYGRICWHAAVALDVSGWYFMVAPELIRESA